MSETGAARPRIILVTRATEYEELIANHGTREQARFFLAGRGLELDEIDRRHRELQEALRRSREAVPTRWRFVRVDRNDLAQFVFEPGDLVLVVGQDGLVANAAKYLEGQMVVGVNPAPGRYPGVLVRHSAATIPELLRGWSSGRLEAESRTMVEARLDDGQRLVALNEIFVGHRSHQSARYRIEYEAAAEDQSSSGVIVASGTGASGWALSISRERLRRTPLPSPTQLAAVFFVREAWPSPATSTRIAEGSLGNGSAIAITSQMNEGGVVFGDGIEVDRLDFPWGRRVEVGVAPNALRLAVAS